MSCAQGFFLRCFRKCFLHKRKRRKGEHSDEESLSAILEDFDKLNENFREIQLKVADQEDTIKGLEEDRIHLMQMIYKEQQKRDHLMGEKYYELQYHHKEKQTLENELEDCRKTIKSQDEMLESLIAENKKLISKKEDLNNEMYTVGMHYLELKDNILGTNVTENIYTFLDGDRMSP